MNQALFSTRRRDVTVLHGAFFERIILTDQVKAHAKLWSKVVLGLTGLGAVLLASFANPVSASNSPVCAAPVSRECVIIHLGRLALKYGILRGDEEVDPTLSLVNLLIDSRSFDDARGLLKRLSPRSEVTNNRGAAFTKMAVAWSRLGEAAQVEEILDKIHDPYNQSLARSKVGRSNLTLGDRPAGERNIRLATEHAARVTASIWQAQAYWFLLQDLLEAGEESLALNIVRENANYLDWRAYSMLAGHFAKQGRIDLVLSFLDKIPDPADRQRVAENAADIFDDYGMYEQRNALPLLDKNYISYKRAGIIANVAIEEKRFRDAKNLLDSKNLDFDISVYHFVERNLNVEDVEKFIPAIMEIEAANVRGLAFLRIAGALKKRGRTETALKYVERTIALLPEITELHAREGIWYDLVQTALLIDNAESVLPHLLIERDKEIRTYNLMRVAARWVQRGKREAGLALYRSVEASFSDLADHKLSYIANYQAYFYAVLNDFSMAIDAAQYSAGIASWSPNGVYISVGEQLAATADFATALAFAAKASPPYAGSIWVGYATAQKKAQDFSGALESYGRAVDVMFQRSPEVIDAMAAEFIRSMIVEFRLK